MELVILADDHGSKLWPITSEALPKALLPVYSAFSLLETTIYLTVDMFDGINVVVTEEAKKSIDESNLLESVGQDPDEVCITVPSYKNELVSIMAALEHLKQNKKIDPDEFVTIMPPDGFYLPAEGFIFHCHNSLIGAKAHPDKIIIGSIDPGAIVSADEFIQGDWSSAKTVGTIFDPKNYAKEDDEEITSGLKLSTFILDVTKHRQATVLKEMSLQEKSQWLVSIGIYMGKFELLYEYVKKALGEEQSQNIAQRTNWDSIEGADFIESVVPAAIQDGILMTTIFSNVSWFRLDNWSTIKFLTHDLELVEEEKLPDINRLDANRNFVFRPPGKKVVLMGVDDLIIIDTGDTLVVGSPRGMNEFL